MDYGAGTVAECDKLPLALPLCHIRVLGRVSAAPFGDLHRVLGLWLRPAPALVVKAEGEVVRWVGMSRQEAALSRG